MAADTLTDAATCGCVPPWCDPRQDGTCSTCDKPLRITAEALRAVAWCEAVGPHPQSEAAFRHAVFFGWLVQDPCWQATPAGREALARHEAGDRRG